MLQDETYCPYGYNSCSFDGPTCCDTDHKGYFCKPGQKIKGYSYNGCTFSTTSTCTNFCNASGTGCGTNICDEAVNGWNKSPSKAVLNSQWTASVAKSCSGCSGTTKIQKRADSNMYPGTASVVCYTFPSIGSSASWSGRGNVYRGSTTVNGSTVQWFGRCSSCTSCKGTTFWEAVEICAKLGLNLPTLSYMQTNAATLKSAIGGYHVWINSDDYTNGTNNTGQQFMAYRYNLNSNAQLKYSRTDTGAAALCVP